MVECARPELENRTARDTGNTTVLQRSRRCARLSIGLAIALIFGILVSTLLTLVVVPVLYYVVKGGRFKARNAVIPAAA